MKRLFITALLSYLTACSEPSSKFISGMKGDPGDHTPIPINTEGNPYGYYEYIPLAEHTNRESKLPIIFFWNGRNAITGNGQSELNRLLTQGLPKFIHDGKHYPAIIISGMLPVWNKSELSPFVDYILERYKTHIDSDKIYMTGFSAGGGVTIRYASEHPEKLAAIVPIAPAAQPPNKEQPTLQMAKVSSWFFHNSGDMTVEIWRSNVWHKALRNLGGEHRITRPDLDSHYAWQDTYSSTEMWQWLFSQSKNRDLLVSSNND